MKEQYRRKKTRDKVFKISKHYLDRCSKCNVIACDKCNRIYNQIDKDLTKKEEKEDE